MAREGGGGRGAKPTSKVTLADLGAGYAKVKADKKKRDLAARRNEAQYQHSDDVAPSLGMQNLPYRQNSDDVKPRTPANSFLAEQARLALAGGGPSAPVSHVVVRPKPKPKPATPAKPAAGPSPAAIARRVPNAAPSVVGNSSAIPTVVPSSPAAVGTPAPRAIPGAPATNNSPNSRNNPAAVEKRAAVQQAADILKRATESVNVDLNPQEAAIDQQIKNMNDSYARDAQQGAYSTASRMDELKQIYDGLNNDLGKLPTETNQLYDKVTGQVNDNYAALQKALSSNFGGATQNLTDQLQQLGLDRSIPSTTGRLTADQQFLSGLAGVYQNAETGTLGNQRLADVAALQNKRAGAAVQGADLQGNTLRDYGKTSEQARFDNSQGINTLTGQRGALEATRAGKVYENQQALQQAAAQAEAQRRQQEIENNFTQQGLDIKGQVAGADSELSRVKAQVELGNLSVAQTRAETDRLVANGTITHQQAQDAVARANAVTNARNATTNENKAGAAAPGKGVAAAASYVSKNADAQTATLVNTIIGRVMRKFPNDKNNAAGNFKNAALEAQAQINASTTNQAARNLLDQAIAIAYGF